MRTTGLCALVTLLGCESERDAANRANEVKLDVWLATLPSDDIAAQADVVKLERDLAPVMLPLTAVQQLAGADATLSAEGELVRLVTIEAPGDRAHALTLARTLVEHELAVYTVEVLDGRYRLSVELFDVERAHLAPFDIRPVATGGAFCFHDCTELQRRVTEKTASLRRLETSRARLRRLQVAEKELKHLREHRLGRGGLPLLDSLSRAEWLTHDAKLILTTPASLFAPGASLEQCAASLGKVVRCDLKSLPMADGGLATAFALTVLSHE